MISGLLINLLDINYKRHDQQHQLLIASVAPNASLSYWGKKAKYFSWGKIDQEWVLWFEFLACLQSVCSVPDIYWLSLTKSFTLYFFVQHKITIWRRNEGYFTKILYRVLQVNKLQTPTQIASNRADILPPRNIHMQLQTLTLTVDICCIRLLLP